MTSAVLDRRPRDAETTRTRILAAARQCFSQTGYGATGIRDIAAVAGVSYTLIGRYFGSKAGLLEAAIIDTIRIDPVLAVDRASFGANLARLIIKNLTDDHPTAMTILAASDPAGRAIALRLVEEHVIGPLADWLGGPQAHDRAVAITMLGGGFVTYTRQLPLVSGPIATDHPLALWLASAVQQIVDQPDQLPAPQ
jgi:AcrR family transcriptional regulator